MKSYHVSEVRDAIKKEVKKLGSQKKLADACGVSSEMVSAILRGKKDPCGAVLEHVGFKKSVIYIKTRHE